MITFSVWETKKKKQQRMGLLTQNMITNMIENEHFARANIITKEKESMKVKGRDSRRNNKEEAPQPCRQNCDERRLGRKN